jgi:dihydroorotate dehydrogenase electron transfer subunit
MMRRPFAYSGSTEKGFSFIYEIRGSNTSDLADLDDGTQVDWIGPLGSSFILPSPGSLPVLVAGGIGVGPLYYLAGKIAEAGMKSLVVLGARNSELLPHLDWPENTELRICTDDGSAGIHGSVLKGLEDVDSRKFEHAEFFACGPRPMMAAVHRMAEKSDRRCQVSLEEMMACGVGACQGCAVQVSDSDDLSRPKFKRICVEGPVFNSREIVW